MTITKAAIEAADLTRPIIGIENRTAQEVFDIMCDRIKLAPAPEPPANSQGSLDGSGTFDSAGLSGAVAYASEALKSTEAISIPSPRKVVAADPLRAQLVEVLKGYEAWEGDIVLNGDWSDDFPKLTEPQYDRLMELQAMRNSALRAAEDAKE